MDLQKVLSRIGDSKTYVLLLLLALLAFITCLVAAAFGQQLWDRFFDLLLGQSVAGAGRAAIVDGAPKIAASWQNPDSQGANPPSAMLNPNPASTSVYDPRSR